MHTYYTYFVYIIYVNQTLVFMQIFSYMSFIIETTPIFERLYYQHKYNSTKHKNHTFLHIFTLTNIIYWVFLNVD